MRYVTCHVIIGFLLFTFLVSYLISSTFHSQQRKTSPTIIFILSSSWSTTRQPLSRKRTRQTEHTNGRRQHRSTERTTDSRSYSSRKESRYHLHIQSHLHHERNDDPRLGHSRETPANPQQRHRQNVNQTIRPKRCLTVGRLATSKESEDNPDEESKKMLNAQNSTFVFKAPITNLHIHK